MSEDITYLDLLVLRKIEPDSSVEKFGQQINTSFFEAANILGTMKIKGLIDIQSSIGGQSPVMITGSGSDVLAAAANKASEPIDALDLAILRALNSGVRELGALQSHLNVRSSDLAYHLYKLKSQDFIDHEIRSAKVFLSLTEKGFLTAGGKEAPANVPSAAARETVEQAAKPSLSLGASAPKDIEDLLGLNEAPAQQIQKSAQKPQPASKSQPSFQAPKLDRRKMLASKLEYYAKAYAPFAVLLMLFLLFLAYALISRIWKAG